VRIVEAEGLLSCQARSAGRAGTAGTFTVGGGDGNGGAGGRSGFGYSDSGIEPFVKVRLQGASTFSTGGARKSQYTPVATAAVAFVGASKAASAAYTTAGSDSAVWGHEIFMDYNNMHEDGVATLKLEVFDDRCLVLHRCLCIDVVIVREITIIVVVFVFGMTY
jgi:hypothetical protein